MAAAFSTVTGLRFWISRLNRHRQNRDPILHPEKPLCQARSFLFDGALHPQKFGHHRDDRRDSGDDPDQRQRGLVMLQIAVTAIF